MERESVVLLRHGRRFTAAPLVLSFSKMEDPQPHPPSGNDQTPVTGHGDMASKPPPSVFMLTKSIDPRIAPEDANFTAPTGASSVTQVQQKLLQINTSVHTFNVTPPSAGSVVQKAVVYTMTGRVDMFATTDGSVPAQTAFPVYGRDFSIAKASPLNAMVSNWQVQINNATVQWNNQGFDDLVHLMDSCQTRPDKGVGDRPPTFASHDDGLETLWGMSGVEDMQGCGDVPPGAYQVQFAIPAAGGPYSIWRCPFGGAWAVVGNANTGDSLWKAVAPYAAGAADGTRFAYSKTTAGTPGTDAVEIAWTAGPMQGQPLQSGYNTAGAYYALNFFMVDTVQCPPFGWHIPTGYEDQGLWGINNMLITAQLTDPGQARWLQGTKRGGMATLTYANQWACTGATLWFTYLSPSTTNLEVLPPRCVVPLMYKQVTTFIDNGNSRNPAYATPSATPFSPAVFSIQVPSYTFSQVSDLIVISVRPYYNPYATFGQTGYLPFNQADFCAALPDQVFSQFQYANIPGILSNLAANQIVSICKKNGSKTPVVTYGGLTGQGLMMKSGCATPMGGSVVVIKPGTDFALPIGIAPGSMGNIQLQFTINAINQSTSAQQFVVTTMSLSSGFFVLDNGAARQVLVGLNSKSLYDADVTLDSMDSSKFTGGGLMSTLASFAGKAWRMRKHIGNVGKSVKDAYSAWKEDKGGGGPPSALAGGGMARSAGVKRRAQEVTFADQGYAGGGSAARRGGPSSRGSLLEAIAGSDDY